MGQGLERWLRSKVQLPKEETPNLDVKSRLGQGPPVTPVPGGTGRRIPELTGSRVNEKFYLNKQDGKCLRKTSSIDLWLPQAHQHTPAAGALYIRHNIQPT